MSRSLRRLAAGVAPAACLVWLLLPGPAARADTPGLPQNGRVTAGAATIDASTAGTLAITTTMAHTAIAWDSFSIDSGNRVTITQPSSTSTTYNSVTGADPSRIFGSLSSNGQVILANPNGIWFGANAHVDVASIVASTATASQSALASFAAGGKLMLDQAGNASASIVNDGTISIGAEGLAALVAPGVANNGIIAARLGHVVLGAGSLATVDFYGDGLINFAVGGTVTGLAKDAAGTTLTAAVANAGTIHAEGGTVLMTATAAESVVNATINMSGVVIANAVDTGKGGEIDLEGGSGTTTISGTLDASATTGKGGGINISGGTVQVAAAAQLNTNAATGGALTINAQHDIDIAAPITIQGSGNLTLNAGTDRSLVLDAPISFTGTGASLTINNTRYTLISSVADLEGIAIGLNGNYALATDLDAASIGNFNPIGSSAAAFDGRFQGLRHTIRNLTITLPASDELGLFGATGTDAVIANVTVANAMITGHNFLGAIVGSNNGTVINSQATGTITGFAELGGLAGYNSGTISESDADSTVNASTLYDAESGGLVGFNVGTITASWGSGTVIGGNIVGGLVGYNSGSISDSYATTSVSAQSGGLIGWLVGSNGGTITESWASGTVIGSNIVGGLVGYSSDSVSYSYVTTSVSELPGGLIGGLVGSNGSGSVLGNLDVTTWTPGSDIQWQSSSIGGLAGSIAVPVVSVGFLCSASAYSGCGGGSYSPGYVGVYSSPTPSTGGIAIVSIGTVSSSGTLTVTATPPPSPPPPSPPPTSTPPSPPATHIVSLSLPGSVLNPRVAPPMVGPGGWGTAATLPAVAPAPGIAIAPPITAVSPTDYANAFLASLLPDNNRP